MVAGGNRPASWLRREGRVLLICIGISFFIWLLRTLTEDATSTIAIPVTFTEIPEGACLMESSATQLLVDVNSSGFGLIGRKLLGADDRIEVSLASFSGRYGRLKIGSDVVSDDVKELLGDYRELVRIRPDSLSFNLSVLNNKSIPVVPTFTENLGGGYFFKQHPSPLPEIVIVRGPKEILDTLNFIRTLPFVADESEEARVPLIVPYLCTIDEVTEVKIRWTIEQWTEHVLRVGITDIHKRDGYELKLLPDSVDIHFFAGSERASMLSPNDFRVVVREKDPESIARSGATRLPLMLDSIPMGIRDVSLDPGRIEYLIIR
jgi:hypothetical protein